jgi:hypothetical protein
MMVRLAGAAVKALGGLVTMNAFLYLTLLAVVFLSLALILNTGGWFLVLVGIYLFPVLLIAHCFVHVRAISRRPRVGAILSSHLLLLTAFLLRVDSGDASSFVAIDVMARHLGVDFRVLDWMSGSILQVLSLCLFVLVAVSWLFVYPFSDPTRGGQILVAILLPWWHFYTRGRRLAAALCFVLVLSTTGWIPASIWALVSLLKPRTDEDAEEGPVAGPTDCR